MLKGHSQLRDRADLDMTFASLKSVYLNPKSNVHMSYQTSSKRSPPFWLLIGARKLLCFSAQSEGRTAATVWNLSGKTLSPGALLAVLYFSSCHIFLPFRLSLAPTICPWVSEDGFENDWGVILSPPAFRKRSEKIRKFSAQWIVHNKQSTNNIVQNKACKMWKIAAKLSKFPLEFLLEACQQLNI